MPRDKDRKRIIRARMKKTGESYTAARARIISRTTKSTRTIPAADYPRLAGMSDDKISTVTRRTWAQWVRTLDALRAAAMPHRQIAALVQKQFNLGDWWAQSVTVGYERITGLRERGQRRDGTYETTKSRTFAVPVTVLFDAWANRATRRQWLDDVDPVVRKATAAKSMRLQWHDGTKVEVGFFMKGTSKSAVAVAHTKLGDRTAAASAKEYWTERLDRLTTLLRRD